MAQNYQIDGNWFHSRSSSNYPELQSVRNLVIASRKSEYHGLNWAGGRHTEPLLYQFAGEIRVAPSTMQTKIRAMVRYGFVQESHSCPLGWTRLGQLWHDLDEIGEETAAREIYQVTLAHSLSLFAFNAEGYAATPQGSMFPLRALLLKMRGGQISIGDFRRLVDGHTSRKGKNASYWLRDLLNSGLVEECGDSLVVAERFKEFSQSLRSASVGDISPHEWAETRKNQLRKGGLFRAALSGLLNKKSADNWVGFFPLENAFAETLDNSLLNHGYNLEKNTTTREFSVIQRNAAWGRFVKERYNSACVMPACDVHGSPFVEAAHIKPHKAANSTVSHRAHILNGLCLCRHCHSAFDDGLFSINENNAVMLSSRLAALKHQHPKFVIEQSKDRRIRTPLVGKPPCGEFVRYHREKVFRNDAVA